MKKILSKLSLIILLITGISCNSDDDKVEINDFKGYYRIKSISSSLPIDLNNDGSKTTDYLQEIKSTYISFNGNEHNFKYDNELIYNFAVARPTKNQQNFTQFLDIRFPTQQIDSIFQGNDNFAISNMGYDNIQTAFIYKLTNNDVEIESDPLNQFEYYDIRNFKISRINKVEFEISFDYKVYDFTEDEWIETNLSSQYIKVPE
ncbi:hypothetical protein RM553_13060 [Zunongwangia sp. F363]|uniref:Uncharacterized protein n=1 Tax=Autumnicola tepida TaxID=3075595 RepID=A0ABU3CCK7_9FLAO|nr:hypothetical protein [Zunongwangia sp. F363]MDT0643765.1 hypothetical protein [Zunongwangia sp. F363]